MQDLLHYTWEVTILPLNRWKIGGFIWSLKQPIKVMFKNPIDKIKLKKIYKTKWENSAEKQKSEVTSQVKMINKILNQNINTSAIILSVNYLPI